MTCPSRLNNVWQLSSQSKDFRHQWEGLYDNTMKYVRIHCVDLLSDNVWQDVVKYQLDGQVEIVKKFAHGLLSDVVKHFDDKIHRLEDNLVSDKMSYIVTRDELKKTYENDPYTFIETLVRCLKEEEMLIESFTKPSEEQIEQENITQSIRLQSDIQKLEEGLKHKVNSLCSLIEESHQKTTELQKKEQEKNDAQDYAENNRRRNNGVNHAAVRDKLQSEIDHLQERHNNISSQMDTVKHDIKDILRKFLNSGKELQAKFTEVIKKWKYQTKMKYVGLSDTEYTLHGPEDRCKKFGKLLHAILEYVQTDVVVSCSPCWEMENDVDMQSTINCLYQLFEDLCQCTFLVCEQTRHLVKVELGSKKRTKDAAEDDDTKPGQNFKCPKFNACVRLIATEGIGGRQKVKAYFCHQQTLNNLEREKRWEALDMESFPMQEKSNARLMGFSQQGYASFKNLELTNFRRDQDKHVCEEKYRIVFTTEQMVAGRIIKLRTLSLPMIITTGASQGSNAHGSLLWQCFSVDDVMKFPLESPAVLPWSTVAAMLNAKFKTLGGRDLRQDELQHLASRVSGIPTSNLTKDTEIQFRKFCLDKMMDYKETKEAKNKSATFWMWVLSVYNLTKFHLQEYWNEDLIDGFSAKEDSDWKLKSIIPFKNFTFLLRFSDKVITDGQGQNMCGAISAAFVYQTEEGGEKCLKVGNAKPFKAESFKKKNLAQLVKSVHIKEHDTKEASLDWIFPGKVSRDDAFQSFYQSSRKLKVEDADYILFQERLYLRLKDLSIDEVPYPKDEPTDDVPLGKRAKPNMVEQTPPCPPFEDQHLNDLMAGLEKINQPSPSSTIYGGELRNSNESTPMSQEHSPASAYTMSPQMVDNSLSNMIGGITSPQSSIDESQGLSPEQEASIPVTVLDKIGYPAVTSNAPVAQVYQQTGQVLNRSCSLPEQHPTLMKFLTTNNARDELRAMILSRQSPGVESTVDSTQMGFDPSMLQQQPVILDQGNGVQLLDLNTVRNEYTNGKPQMDMLPASLEMSSNNQFMLQNPPLYSDAVGMQEVEISASQNVDMIENYENSRSPDQVDFLDSGGIENVQFSPEQLDQMVSDPEQFRQFGQLLTVMTDYLTNGQPQDNM